MCTYPFKALSANGKELVAFTLADGPWRHDTKFFSLANRPGSPILKYNTIRRGSDIPGLFEGDIIEYNGKKYCIKYEMGLAAFSLDGEVIPVNQLSYIKIVDNVYFQKEFKLPNWRKVTFKYVEKEDKRFLNQHRFFGIKSITGAMRNKPFIAIYGCKLVPEDDILQFTGVTYKDERIHFGECIEGNPVYMEKGRIYVRAFGKCHDVKSSPILLQLSGKYNESHVR